MKAIPKGYATTFTLTVSDAMTVDFEQPETGLGKLHPVYATYWMTKHMELASRQLTLPFLDADEEGIGFEVAVKHLASALPGMQVTIQTRHLATRKTRVYTECEAYSELGDKIGEGSTTQVILPRDVLERGFESLKRRWLEHQDSSETC